MIDKVHSVDLPRFLSNSRIEGRSCLNKLHRTGILWFPFARLEIVPPGSPVH